MILIASTILVSTELDRVHKICIHYIAHFEQVFPAMLWLLEAKLKEDRLTIVDQSITGRYQLHLRENAHKS